MREFTTKELLVLQERNLKLRERIIKKQENLDLKNKREKKLSFEMCFLSLDLQTDFNFYSKILKLRRLPK